MLRRSAGGSFALPNDRCRLLRTAALAELLLSRLWPIGVVWGKGNTRTNLRSGTRWTGTDSRRAIYCGQAVIAGTPYWLTVLSSLSGRTLGTQMFLPLATPI